MSETLKKKWKNFAELKIKRLRKKFAQKIFERQGGSSSMKKLSVTTRNTGRCTELKVKQLGWHKKLAASMYPRNPNWHLSSGSEVSTVWAQQFKRCYSSFASGRSSVTVVKLIKTSVNMLRIVEPYIPCGYPNLKSVNELIYKCGYDKINKKRLALTDNTLMARSLGK